MRAVAYLKITLADDDPRRGVELEHEDNPVLRSAGGRLLVAYLVDQGDRFSYVQVRHLKAAGMTEDALHAQAIANLTRLAERHLTIYKTGNIYPVILDGNFEASLLLVDEIWTEWYPHLAPGGFVVAFPERVTLAFGDASVPETIPELEAMLARVPPDADHPLTNDLYHRVGDCWVPWRS